MSMKSLGRLSLAVSFACMSLVPLKAHAPSGAIFTTLPDGSEVNYNIYDLEEGRLPGWRSGVGAPQDRSRAG